MYCPCKKRSWPIDASSANQCSVSQGTDERIANVQQQFLRQRPEVLTERVHRRLVLDGHGDL